MSISANYGPPADRNQGITIIVRPTKRASRSSIPPRSTDRIRAKSSSEKRSRPFRDKVAIATKFGFDIEGPADRNSQPDHIKKVVEGSLKRLRTDRIDLYYQHRVDPKVPIEDVAGAVKDLIGRERSCTSASPRRARGPSAARMPFNRWPQSRPSTRSWTETRSRTASSQTCEELGIGFVPWGPVGMGYLTGKIDARARFDPKTDLRSGFARFTPEPGGEQAGRRLDERFARERDATPAQIALAWLLAQKPFIVPIPGTRNIDHLTENLGALNVALTPADLQELDSDCSKITVHGARMDEANMQIVE